MNWEQFGFKEGIFNTDPINQETLELYTGQRVNIRICKNVLDEKNTITVIEGARGVGTTSFANYLRFWAQGQKHYFTPRNEIKVDRDWNVETLLGVVVSNIVREIEVFQPKKIIKDKRFQNAKALSIRIAEAYRSIGLSALGVGASYGKTTGINSQPLLVSSAVLEHHLEDLCQLIHSVGYSCGILIQLNNLDINTLHEEKHLAYLMNGVRDYFQINAINLLQQRKQF